MILLERLMAFLAPYDCMVCGTEGARLCEPCRQEYLRPLPSRCYQCKVQTVDSRTCPKCHRYSPLRHVWVSASYDELAGQLVKDLKFARAKDVHQVLAAHMVEALPFLAQDTIVVAVPTASARVRQRGFDQAQLIARKVASLGGLREATLLLRQGQSRQVGAGRKQRLQQLTQAFRVPYLKADYVHGKNILLVDDIVTTGATLEAAAKVLKKAGARSISAVVFAQK